MKIAKPDQKCTYKERNLITDRKEQQTNSFVKC